MFKRKHNTDEPNNKRKRNLFIYIGVTLLFFLSIGIGYAAHIYNKTEEIVSDSHEDIGRENNTSNLRAEEVDPIEDNVSVLFIGVDESEKRDYETASRSDALILATFNKEQNSIKLLSIPRDSYVYVPEIGYNTKINHAHFYGGPKATIETVENFLNVPVDYYVRVNFEAFIGVINSLGGITYDVPFEIYEQDSNDNADAIHLQPGEQLLNGEEALALARSRKYDSDIERGKRQQEIIKRIGKKATSASTIFKLGNVLDAIGPNLKTNLTFDEMKSFLTYGINKNIAIEMINLDGSGGFMDDDLWYYVVDEESRASVQEELREHLDLSISNKNTTDFAKDDLGDKPSY
ncbi:LCP family protein [Virgibacillus oceani]|uniref:LytR family transcriptional regulator n=1 Tax=Virgibacillus oceani TaxID=1479511 RepID=A0A917M2L9_9BACI|nr:LCP family protein [Virgibacillus oceani]GGG73306.1 LytR family transcriptional regulator [Virgibacillus oceani]